MRVADLRAAIGRLLVVGIPGQEIDAATREAEKMLRAPAQRAPSGAVVARGAAFDAPRRSPRAG